MSQQEKIQQQPVTALQDLIAGGIAGSASVCVGHPFDTYKVMLQTSTSTSTSTSSGGIWNNNGGKTGPSLSIMKLYRGMSAPLSTAAVVNALIFSSFGESSRLWDDYFFPQEGYHHPTKDVPLHEHPHTNESPDHTTWQKSFVCGSFAGAVQALVICPTEHVKCRLQIQNNMVNTCLYRGPFDALHKIVSGHGIRGLYRGFACTTWREVPAFGLYFSAYDYIKDTVSDVLASSSMVAAVMTSGTSNHEASLTTATASKNMLHTWAASSLAGGLSGALTWAIIYPFDVIKTRIQTTPLDTPVEKRRMLYIYRQIMQEHGWKFFFRGLGVTLLRAFPVNAIIFPVYEFTLEHLTETGIGGTTTLVST